MTRDETIKILMVIQAAYPNFKPPDKTVAVNLWHEMLSDYPYEKVSVAVKAYIRTDRSGFAPGIGAVVDIMQSLFGDQEKSEAEAWELVLKAVGNSGYNAEEEFQKLPEILKRVVGGPQSLREMALSEKFNASVESSNFKKLYRIEIARENERKKLSPDLQRLIKNKSQKISKIQEDKNVGIRKKEPCHAPIDLMDRARERLGIYDK